MKRSDIKIVTEKDFANKGFVIKSQLLMRGTTRISFEEVEAHPEEKEKVLAEVIQISQDAMLTGITQGAAGRFPELEDCLERINLAINNLNLSRDMERVKRLVKEIKQCLVFEKEPKKVIELPKNHGFAGPATEKDQ